MKIMEMVHRQILPRQIATFEAFLNALAVDMALGCSTNTVLHVPAIAKEAGIDLPLNLINEVSDRTPHLCSLSPAGPHHLEDLDRAGGVQAVMQTLLRAGLITGTPLTATGMTVADNLAGVEVLDPEVIRPLTNPYHAQGGLAILWGNLAPQGAVVKQSAVDEKMRVKEGRARVFDSEEDATAAILKGAIEPGDSWSSATKAPKAARACGRCSLRPPPSPAWAWIKMWLSSPTAASPAPPGARPSAMSLPRPRKVAPSPWSRKGTAFKLISPKKP